MTDIPLSWSSFRDTLAVFARSPRDVQRRWWFRGQSKVSHELEATIDRGQTFASIGDRQTRIEQLLYDFRREAVIVTGQDVLPPGDDLELLARHHGLPSPLLDWTQSPWVAVFFAFQSALRSKEDVAVFAVNRSALDPALLVATSGNKHPALDLIDEPERIKFNRRALQQRGVFLRVSTTASLKTILGSALRRYVLPIADREQALRELDIMLLNATTLMYDLDGAASTAVFRNG